MNRPKPSASPAPRARRPRLKVVGGTPRDRHVSWYSLDGQLFALEVWPSGEWEALHPAERPAETAYLPGVGRYAVWPIGEDERGEIDERIRAGG